jgi:DNA polymerase theta
MSATVGNIRQLADWFHAKLFISDFRPIPLLEHVVIQDEVFDTEGKQKRKLQIQLPTVNKPKSSSLLDEVAISNNVLVHLCMEALCSGQQVLIFCPTKFACQEVCQALVALIVPLCKGTLTHSSVSLTAEQIIVERVACVKSVKGDDERDDVEDTGRQSKKKKTNQHNHHRTQSEIKIIETLSDSVPHGIAFHHAGMDSSQRKSIETLFRSGGISILAATSTLAAGVNLPAGRVIIQSLAIG